MTIITTKGERLICDRITIEDGTLRADGDALHLEDVREIRDGDNEEMTVDNLTEDELLQLKDVIFWGDGYEIDPHHLKTDAAGDFLYTYADEIPLSLVHYYFDHISFVPDDFWCNA